MYKYKLGLTKKEWQAQQQKEISERLKKWRALTPQEQLQSLDERGMRAIKQRTKIKAKIK